MYWYIFFVQAGSEYRVVQFLKQKLDTNKFIPFVPLLEVLFRTNGTVKKQLKPLFPGYVFVESEVLGQEFVKKTNELNLSSFSDIIRLLRYSDTEIAMREQERQMLLEFCNDNYCIEASEGFIKGNRIYITHGSFKGRECVIKKVNRHKRQAVIEMCIMGDTKMVTVALEIIKKI